MEFTEFAQMLVAGLEIDYDGPLVESTGMFDDIGVDSFGAFRMLIIIETTAGLDVPPPDLPEIYTLGDAYAYYRAASQLAAASR